MHIGAAVIHDNIQFPQADRLGTIPLVVAIGHAKPIIVRHLLPFNLM